MTDSQVSRQAVLGAVERNNAVWVVLGLALGPAVVLGLARFAYALLLPAMRAGLHWSLATAGAMNSANALGYLAGALATARLARRYGARRTFLAGLGVTVASLLLTATTGDTLGLLSLRALAGVSGAVTFIAGAGLVACAAAGTSAHRTAMLLGIYFAGGGAGIVISGLSVPALLASIPASTGWRWGWVLLGALGAAALVPAWLAARASAEPPPPPPHDRCWPARHFVALLASYALFGAGYIAYMTFVVAFLHDGGARTGEITAFWVLLGAASILGAFAWVRPIARLRGGRGASIVLAVVGRRRPATALALRSGLHRLRCALRRVVPLCGDCGHRGRPPVAATASLDPGDRRAHRRLRRRPIRGAYPCRRPLRRTSGAPHRPRRVDRPARRRRTGRVGPAKPRRSPGHDQDASRRVVGGVTAEMRYLDDFVAGQVYELGSHTVSAEEIIDFASQWDPQSFHTDPSEAAHSAYGSLIASGWHTCAMTMRMRSNWM